MRYVPDDCWVADPLLLCVFLLLVLLFSFIRALAVRRVKHDPDNIDGTRKGFFLTRVPMPDKTFLVYENS